MGLLGQVRQWKSGSFVHSVGVLMLGTLVAHAITLAALVLITRLYSPEDFSVLAVFNGLVLTAGAVACLRLDVAIPLPASDDDALNLLTVACLTCAGICVVLAIPALAMPEQAARWLGQPLLEPHLWLVPLGTLLFGWQSALQLWTAREKAFNALATSRVSQALAGSGTQLGLGWTGAGPLGLLLGQIGNTGMVVIVLAARLVGSRRTMIRDVSVTRMRSQLRVYDSFPKFSTPEQLFNGIQVHLPVVLIAALAAGPEAGYLNLAMYAMAAPMSLIGAAIAQVYLSRAPDEHRGNRLAGFTTSVLGGLLKTGVGPLLFAGIVAPVLFAPVFGAQWQRAGELISWMTPWFVAQFLVSPVSMSLYVTNRPRTALLTQAAGAVVRVLSVLCVARIAGNYVSEAFALSGFAYYGAYLAVVLVCVAAKPVELAREVRRAIPVLAVWVLSGLAVRWLAVPLLDWVK